MATEQSAGGPGPSLIWGLHEVLEALAAGHPVSRIYFARQAKGPLVERIKELAGQRYVRFDFVEVGKLGRLAGTREHQDVVARISPVRYAGLEAMWQDLAPGQRRTVVALDQVRYSRNIGLAIRTAAGAGAAAVLLPNRGGRLVDDEVVRASAGAVFRLGVVPSANLVRDLERLKEHGFWVYGLEAGAGQEVFAARWPERRVLVVGNETRGLRPLVRRTADALLGIPLAPGMDSLNVAVALGVALFDIVRQERERGADGQGGIPPDRDGRAVARADDHPHGGGPAGRGPTGRGGPDPGGGRQDGA